MREKKGKGQISSRIGIPNFEQCQLHSAINSGRGSFHGSCPSFASEPSFRGFIPSSRAICVCTWLNLKRLLASNQGCSFAGIRFIHHLSSVIAVSPLAALRILFGRFV